jgi:hypothetical protein
MTEHRHQEPMSDSRRLSWQCDNRIRQDQRCRPYYQVYSRSRGPRTAGIWERSGSVVRNSEIPLLLVRPSGH